MSSRLKVLSTALAVGLVLIFAACSSSNDFTGTEGDGQVQFLLSSSGSDLATSSDAIDGLETERGVPGDALSTLSPDHDSDDDSSDDNNMPGNGFDPRPHIESASATFASFLARNQDGELIPVDIELPTTVDLLALHDGDPMPMPLGSLPAGTYDQVVVVIVKLSLVLRSGLGIDLTPPGGGWTVVVPICPFTIDEGASTTVKMNFLKYQSFSPDGGGFGFHPRFECDEVGIPEPF
jgi:hypothetical protein